MKTFGKLVDPHLKMESEQDRKQAISTLTSFIKNNEGQWGTKGDISSLKILCSGSVVHVDLASSRPIKKLLGGESMSSSSSSSSSQPPPRT